MAKAATKKVPNVTRKDIEEYLSIEEQRKSLARQSKDLKAKADVIEEKLFAFAKAKGGPGRSVLRSGYVLAINIDKGAVAWKSHFVGIAGVEAAEALIALAPTKESLSVQPAKATK